MNRDVAGPAGPSNTTKAGPSGKSVRILGTASIAGISLAAVLTLRGMPSVAEYGWASIGLYVFGAIFFLIPLALVCAELGTGWPKAGGLYAWVRQGFGPKSGFLAVWFEWIEGIVWFPTVLAFVAATIAYIFAPALSNNKVYLVLVMLGVFWGMTLINFLGLRWTSLLNNVGVTIGTLLPAAILIALGIYWLAAGKHIAIPFSAGKLLPNFGSINNLVFFVGVLLGYAGIELFGFHAKETKDPQHTYPRGDHRQCAGDRGDIHLCHPGHLLCRSTSQAQSRSGSDAGVRSLLQPVGLQPSGYPDHGGSHRPWHSGPNQCVAAGAIQGSLCGRAHR